jgi:hypothetical protein
MAVTIFGLIQHRRGIKADLPDKLEEGELGFCVDTRELFIGNTLPHGGNTQIFTDAVDVVQLAQYSFVSDTQVPSQTGTSMSQPIVRSLQAQLDDAWVNVKAYGAQGDGITDDTAAINRAIEDLYTKQLTTSENVRQARKTVWFPAGRYLVSDPILVYPEVSLQGENYQNTQLFQAVHTPSKLCLLRLADSRGQTGANLGLNSAQLPVRQQVRDLNLHVQNATQIVLLERPNLIEFDNCWFSSVWIGPTVTPGTEVTGITIQTLGSTPYGDVWVNNCVFTNMEWAVNCIDPAKNIHILNSTFKQLYLGIITAGAPGPTHVKVQNCVFDQITQQAVKVMSTQFVSSMHNTYLDVNGGGASIYWHTTTSLCVSIADQFDAVPGVQDLGANNLLINSQQNNLISQLGVTPTTTNAAFYPVMSNVVTGTTLPVTSSLFSLNPNPAAPVLSVQAELRTQGWVQNYREDIVNTTITLLQSDQVLGVAPGATVNLPSAPVSGKTYSVKDVVGTASGSPINVQPGTGASVDAGAANAPYVLNTNWGSVTLMYKSTSNKWLIM